MRELLPRRHWRRACCCRRLYPAVIEIYDLWSQVSPAASDGVGWNDVTKQGRVAASSHDGWRDDWSQDRGWPGVDPGGVAEIPPSLWQLTGFERAYGGVRQVGARFALDAGGLPAAGLALFVHVSRPKQDLVITEPVPFLLEAGSRQPTTRPTIEPAHEKSVSSIGQWLDERAPRIPAGDAD